MYTRKITVFILISLLLSACGSNQVRNESVLDTFNKAEIAYRNNDYTEARRDYEEVLRQVPDHIGAMFRLANILMQQHDYTLARQYYEQVLALQPSHASAHHNLAMLDMAEAENHLNYYIATSRETETRPGLESLLRAISEYTKGNVNKKSSLDNLAELVKTTK